MPNYLDQTGLNTFWTKIKSLFPVITSASSVAGSSTSGAYLSVRWYVSGADGVTTPYDGMRIMLKIPRAGVSTAGVVLSLNGNNAADYHPVAYNVSTVLTSHYAANSYKIFTYDASASMTCYLTSNTSSTVTGVWKAEADYDSTNVYQLRQNSGTWANKTGYSSNRYTLLCEVDGGLSGFAQTIATGTTKTVVTPKYIPNGKIFYYSTNGEISNGSNFGASGLYEQIAMDLRYTFNIGTSVISAGKPVYMRCSVNADGTLSPDYQGSPSHPIVVALPSTADGKVYVFLGRAYSTSSMELYPEHPIYEFKNGNVRMWQAPQTASEVGALPSSTAYVASASVSNNTLTITPSTGNAITFSPTAEKTFLTGKWTNKTGYSVGNYHLVCEVDGGLCAFNTATSSNNTSKTTVSPHYIPNGAIAFRLYVSYTSSNSVFETNSLYQQATESLQYSFNIGGALLKSGGGPVYIKCSVNSDGTVSPSYDMQITSSAGHHPIVTELPSTEDGYVYVYLGRSTSATNLALSMTHPIYEYKNGAIRLWQQDSAGGSVEIIDLT